MQWTIFVLFSKYIRGQSWMSDEMEGVMTVGTVVLAQATMSLTVLWRGHVVRRKGGCFFTCLCPCAAA